MIRSNPRKIKAEPKSETIGHSDTDDLKKEMEALKARENRVESEIAAQGHKEAQEKLEWLNVSK